MLEDVVTKCINTSLKRKTTTTTTTKQPVIAAADGALFITQKELVLNTFTQTHVDHCISRVVHTMKDRRHRRIMFPTSHQDISLKIENSLIKCLVYSFS